MKYLLKNNFASTALSFLFVVSIALSPLAVMANDKSSFEDKDNSAVWQVVGPAGGDVRAVG